MSACPFRPKRLAKNSTSPGKRGTECQRVVTAAGKNGCIRTAAYCNCILSTASINLVQAAAFNEYLIIAYPAFDGSGIVADCNRVIACAAIK